ncbi:MAG: lipopolysaccharide kinase InaA family protein [Candidatus Bathycorpusculaceae bacterium]
MTREAKSLEKEFNKQILEFCRHIAGSCKITAAFLLDYYTFGYAVSDTLTEVLLVVNNFPPKLMNYVKVLNGKNIVVLAVDEWVFERDIERGFLGEAVASGLIFPYTTLVNKEFLSAQEALLKKRLILELLENLVLDFPELSYEIHIKPEYFMYETMLSRARLFPPLIHSLLVFTQQDSGNERVKSVLNGYLEALKSLERDGIINFSGGYVKISEKFVNKVQRRKVRFTAISKIVPRALFTSLLAFFPKILSLLSQNAETLFKFQKKTGEGEVRVLKGFKNPKRFLYVPTSGGLVSLADRTDIETFAKSVLSTGENAKIEVEEIGGVLNDVYLIKTIVNGAEKKIVIKQFKDWSSFKWFPLTLWTFGTRTFAVLGRSRLERECAINKLLFSAGFNVPKILYMNHDERLVFMEYVEGESLDKVIKRVAESKADEEIIEELRIIMRVGETFAKAHALNISLGDTKPENILVCKDGKVYLLDLEQASRNGDKTWDIAEFLYYAGHYVSPMFGRHAAELITKAFINGYLTDGGNPSVIKKVSNPKYSRVFSVFTSPITIIAISNVCRNADKLREIHD